MIINLKINKIKILKIIKLFCLIYFKKNNFIEIFNRKNNLILSYNNLFIRVESIIKKNIKIENFSINFRDFNKLIKNFKKNYIKIRIFKKKLLISDSIKYIIKKENIIKKKISLKNFKNFIKIKKKDLIKLIKFLKFIDKTQENNLKNIIILTKKKKITFIFNNNYHLIYYTIINYEILKTKKYNINVNNDLLKLFENIINDFNDYLEIKKFKKKFLIKIKNFKIISKFKKSKNIILKDFKRNFKNYLFLKKKKLEKILKNFYNFLIKNQEEILIEIDKNYLKIKKKIKNNIIHKKTKIFYKGDKIKFFLNGLNIFNFLKTIESNDLILNFSKKKTLVITLPQIKNFKYVISIIKN